MITIKANNIIKELIISRESELTRINQQIKALKREKHQEIARLKDQIEQLRNSTKEYKNKQEILLEKIEEQQKTNNQLSNNNNELISGKSRLYTRCKHIQKVNSTIKL